MRESRSTMSIGRMLVLLGRLVGRLALAHRRPWWTAPRPAATRRDVVWPRPHRILAPDLRAHAVVRC